MTIRPKRKVDAPDDLDSREDVWSNAPVLTFAARTGSNENIPQVPAWLASRNRLSQSDSPANTNSPDRAEPKGGTGGAATREWLYDWDAPLSEGAMEEKRRGRLFLPRNAVGVQAGKGRSMARRLIASAACLAIVAVIGGGIVVLSDHPARQSVATVAQIEKEKAPAIAGDAAPKSREAQQTAKADETGVTQKAAMAAAAKVPAGVDETQKVAALPAGKPAAKLPLPDSARWASNVVPAGKALSGALGAKSHSTTARSMAAYASVRDDPKPGSAMKPVPEAETASLAPEQKADDSRTSSIPDDSGAAEKARGTMEDIARSRAKPISTGGSRASVTTAVNLRSGPDNHSHVLTVVPSGAAVELFGCNQWCKIAYGGHEGFVYKDFVRHSGHVPAVASRPEKTASKVASSASDNKLIGGVVVDDGSKTDTANEPDAAAAPKPAQPAAKPRTMRHDSR